jgi:peptidyl-prolyl cis-trans isomerase C
MKKILILGVFLCLILWLGQGCGRKSGQDDRLLARVGNKDITLGDFQQKIAKLPDYYKGAVERNKPRFLEETIAEMLFYEEAVRQGVDRDREVRDLLNEAKKKIVIAKFIKSEVEDKLAVSENEERLFYEEHKNEFKTPELWRASHILVDSEQEAKDIAAQLAQGASFDELAKTKSIDATANRGGDIGYFRKGQLIPEFEKSCSKLEVGQVGEILHTQFGYHVIKLTGRKEPTAEEFEAVRQKIGDELKNKKRKELFDGLVEKLKDRYKVEVKGDALKLIETPADNPKEGVR